MISRTSKHQITLADFIRKLITSWLLATLTEYWLLPAYYRNLQNMDGLAHMSMLRVLLITGGTTVILCVLGWLFDTARWERIGMASLFTVLALLSLIGSFTAAFLVVCLLAEAAVMVYAFRGWNCSEQPAAAADCSEKKNRWCLWVTVGAAAAFFLFVSIWTVCRVLSFSVPTYDFGIFSQMFYNMKTHFVPNTTVEREGLLSHLKVHMSPIYYLMLPFYFLAPTPATLQVLQAAVLASAVIPLWKLGTLHNLSNPQKMLICCVFLLCPALTGGTSYDIHENCFLAPLILWLFYGIDRHNWIVTGVSAALTLMVKEDAAVYVAVIALWLLVSAGLRQKKQDRKKLIAGGALLCGSLLWFLAATGYLTKVGDGVMTYRYQNFMYDGSKSLFTAIKAVIMCPMKAVFECVDPEKLQYIALTLLPLLGLPLLTRRYERYILLIPYILVNLMSDYQYQHDVFFQYGFGSLACLMYLTVVNLADIKIDRYRLAAAAAAVLVSGTCFAIQIVPAAARYPQYCIYYGQYYADIRKTLDVIPDGASVSATTFYTTYLSQREKLYDIRYGSKEHILSTEYVVVKHKSKGDYKKYGSEENFVRMLEQNGYKPEAEMPDVITVYHKK